MINITMLFVGFILGVTIWLYWTMPALAGLFVILLAIILLMRLSPRFTAFVIGFCFGLR